MDVVPLAAEWALWRDFAVRSAGFPVSGLDAFGPGDEPARLREVARDPAFREAVAWQNPAALANAVLKVAEGPASKPSRARQREEIVASYWQRYCAKNDTIGFFGPLAWGQVTGEEPPLRARSGALVRERSVHFEVWGVQALAETLDPDLRLPTGPRPEYDLRALLDAHPDGAVRDRGLHALGRLTAARDAVAAAPPASLPEALARLDATFVELTGRDPTRNAGRAYGARTLCYVDCLRELEVDVGPTLVTALAPALRTLFEATRWYCGRVQRIGEEIVERALPGGGPTPFGPVLGRVLGALMEPPPDLGDEVAELERRLGRVLADPDAATIGDRAAETFADHGPAWPHAVFHSVDVQIAARDEAAVAAGDYLAVVGDVHPGANPLVQGVFAHRHPDPPAFMHGVSSHVGAWPMLLPPFGPGFGVDARGFPVTPDDTIHIAAVPETRARLDRRTWLPGELLVDGDELVDASGELRLPLVEAFSMAIFIAAVRTFELLPEQEHAPRVTVGRVVLQRESWSVPAADVPGRAEDLAAFARDRGLPRRVFAKSPLERKPVYLDVESRVLAGILCRHARQAAAASPEHRIRFTEMLPGPDECWLADPEGNRYVSELRLVAVDGTRGRRA